MDTPATKYATSSDGVHIAYQAFGAGPPTVLVPPLVSNIEVVWEHEYNRRVLEYEAQQVRFVQFDKRGVGASDRWDEVPTLQQRIQDITAVLDAEQLDSANLIGLSEGGLMAEQFALAHPDRVERLVLVNTAGSMDPAVLEPFGGGFDPVAMLQQFRRLIETWGTDPAFMVGWMMPSQLHDDAFVEFSGRYQRLTASPAAIERQITSVLSLAPPDHLEQITAPTMVMHSIDDKVLPVSCGRHLASVIPDATYVELDMPDHFLWVNDRWREMADLAMSFLNASREQAVVERCFGALVFSDVVGSTATAAATGDDRWRDALASHDRITAAVIERGHGRIVKRMGDGLVAMFPTASSAVAAATRLRAEVAKIGLTLRIGIHAGEVEVLQDGDIRGLAVHLAARVEGVAAPGEVLVTSTVRELMLGSSTPFVDRGGHALKGIDGDWNLYGVATP